MDGNNLQFRKRSSWYSRNLRGRAGPVNDAINRRTPYRIEWIGVNGRARIVAGVELMQHLLVNTQEENSL